MEKRKPVNLRCSAYRCDNIVSVTDDEMSDPKWRRYMVHCPKHQLPKSKAGGKIHKPLKEDDE
jgi:hypothetical protein